MKPKTVAKKVYYVYGKEFCFENKMLMMRGTFCTGQIKCILKNHFIYYNNFSLNNTKFKQSFLKIK